MITQRQAQLLTMRADGLLSKQIADRLAISKKTVDNHFIALIDRTNCKTSYEVLAKFVMGQLPTLPSRAPKKPVKKLPKERP